MEGNYQNFAQFPENVTESPFNPDAKGTYFAWLTNRKGGCSYLAERADAFCHEDSVLFREMPMGYTSLWILERIVLEIGGNVVAAYGEPAEKIHHIYVILDENGKYERISEEEYKALCQNEVLSRRAVKLTANLLDAWNWH